MATPSSRSDEAEPRSSSRPRNLPAGNGVGTVDGAVPGELLAACRRGDPRALEELVRLTQRRVYNLALRIVGRRHDAEDVMQEAYLRMFRGLAGFREEARFETWMHRIVTNAALNLLRRRGRFGDLLADDGEVDRPVPDRTDVVDGRDQLVRSIARLPEGQRLVLVLKDVYGLSCKEIGEELGIAEGAVKVRLHRARRRLKDVLEEGNGGEV
jgi:RNA polymerase sigma-70 factor (ECF subfamily)